MLNKDQFSLFDSEDPAYLSEQIITYIGNKRALLGFFETAVTTVKEELGKDRLRIADLFSGSGVVSRAMKKHAAELFVNDLEPYCETINRCYLANREELDLPLLEKTYREVRRRLDEEPLRSGFITELYSPADDRDIRAGERVFYTSRNARYIDTARQLIEEAPDALHPFLLAPLLYEASVHTNTSGVFKGFYKNSETGIGQFGGNGRNALSRILADIRLNMPVFSRFSRPVQIMREDAVTLAPKIPPIDLTYLDPPYNQHPYGSNYFMLNLINDYRRPDRLSPVSGIPGGWNKSVFNSRAAARDGIRRLCESLDARYLLISFSDDGFFSRDEMVGLLSRFGELRVMDREYNTYRAARNLSGRELHIREYLYLIRKA